MSAQPRRSIWRGTRQREVRPEAGIVSSLSTVPPVWPRPRPLIIGTGTPSAATSGASTIDTLSPTPPVECLSTLTPGTRQVGDAPDSSMTLDQRRQLGGRHAAEEDGHEEGRHLVFLDAAGAV
jgi:hypothetical protein